MIMPDIDWNSIWKEFHKEKARFRKTGFWDKRAPEFARHARGSDYINQFLAIMNPRPEWCVLDVGSAAGTLAAPMAPLVASVTAMEPSPGFRELLGKRCEEERIKNIRIVNGCWEDDWDDLDIGVHDVVIASRSLIVEDLKEAVMKLQRFATKKVMISTLVGDGPYDRRIVTAAGRDYTPGVDFIVVVNILREMEIFPNLSFTYSCPDPTYKTPEEALESLRWMVHDITETEEDLLLQYLTQVLVRENGVLKMPWKKIVRWAVMWWDIDPITAM